MKTCIGLSKNYGMTLIEVLISLVIFAISMLGIGGMLLMSSKANNSSYSKQQAVQSISNILDRMRANSSAAINGNYNASNINSSGAPTIPSAPSASCLSTACSPADLAAYDVWSWLSKDVTQLPSGSGSITTAPSGGANNTLITVTVQWDDSQSQSTLGGSSATSTANPNMVQLSIQSQL